MSPPGSAWSTEDGSSGHEQSSNVQSQVSGKVATFKINGKKYEVSGLPVSTTLNTFIRDHANLKGTKYMCEEGGCGACIVAANVHNPKTGKTSTMAVNSCLVPIYNCHGWSVETVEALGSSSKGYGKIQARLATNNGTQCGYCSPGMVMNMYSLLRENKDLSMSEIENSFGGNTCRCTGYRPILDAFKSLAKDASEDLVKKCVDIEELTVICPRTKEECLTSCGSSCDKTVDSSLAERKLHLTTDDGKCWYRVNSIKEICEILDLVPDESYMLVCGNTAYGVYRPEKNLTHYIDVNGVAELMDINISEESLTVGANLSLSNTIKLFREIAKSKNADFGYTKQLADHIERVANVPVRNIGSLAGNLSIKHQHKEFPSDIFVIFETVGAQLNIVDYLGMDSTMPLMQLLDIAMNKKIIKSIVLPALNSSCYTFKTYKGKKHCKVEVNVGSQNSGTTFDEVRPSKVPPEVSSKVIN